MPSMTGRVEACVFDAYGTLLDSFRTLQAHPEAVPLLEALRRRGIRTAVLSNGTPATLDVALARAGLAPLLDAVLSVERVQCYKPDPRVYADATAALAVPADRTLFVSMHGWDVAGAASAGCRTAWVNRAGAPRDRLPAGPDHTVRSLAEIELLAFR